MKNRFNLITLALLGVSCQASAFDFGVNAANTSKVTSDKWGCKYCVSSSTQGDINLGLGYADQSNNHAANATGFNDGFAGALDANVRHIAENGVRTEFYSNELGSKRGRAALSASQAGSWDLALEYRSSYLVDTLGATPVVLVDGQHLVANDALVPVALDKSRDTFTLHGAYTGSLLGGYVTLSHQQREGSVRSSLSAGDYFGATNFVLPLDEQTLRLQAGVTAGGDHWAAELGVLGSQYKNDTAGINHNDFWLQQSNGDNKAQSVFGTVKFNHSGTVVTGRLAMGEAELDSELNSWAHQTGSYDASVETLDAMLRVASRINAKVRLNASIDHMDRDNQSYIEPGAHISMNTLSGEATPYVALDISRTKYQVSGDYRLDKDWRLGTGLSYLSTSRDQQYSEDTDEAGVWANVRYRAPWDMTVKAKVAYEERDGSVYEAAEATSSESSYLLRKFNLADRQRHEVSGELSQMVNNSLNWSLEARYSMDDYDDSVLGLIESERTGVDANVDWYPVKDMLLSIYGGYEWVENFQRGAPTDLSAIWAAATDEDFGFVGTHMSYTGLAAEGLTFSMDYSFAFSDSQTETSAAHTLGDYYSYSHNLEVRADYQLTKQMTLGLSYQFERYYDTDYADIPVINYPGDGVPNLTTMGMLGNNYNAHLIMLNVGYKL